MQIKWPLLTCRLPRAIGDVGANAMEIVVRNPWSFEIVCVEGKS